MSKRIVCAILFAFAFVAATPRRVDGAVQVSLSYFHETLAPHGRWVVAGTYGDVWAPSVEAGWAPYVYGDWAYTDFGWTWVSDDPWSDVTFHYGTWTWVDPYGWCWVPGLVWAPAWVTWAYTDDYVGWAPVPPSFVLSASGYVGSPIVVAQTRYVFVPARQFVGVRVASVRVPTQQNAAIFSRATKVTRFPVSGGVVHTAGIEPARIERAAGRRIAPVPVARAARVAPTTIAQARVGKSNRVSVVAPAVERERVVRGRPETAPKHAAAAPADRRAAERGRSKPKETSTSSERRAAESHAVASRPSKAHAAPAAPRHVEKRKPEPAVKPHENAAHTAPPAPPPQRQAPPSARQAERRPAPPKSHAGAPHRATPHANPNPGKGHDNGKPERSDSERR